MMIQSKLMLEKIECAIVECSDAINSCENGIDHSRYNKLLDRLEKLQEGVRADKLFTEVSDLSIIKMIYEHDPKKLWNAVLEVNKVYRKYYSTKVQQHKCE